jgi:hemolysin III
MEAENSGAGSSRPYEVEYTAGEEVSHAVTHGVGALLAVIGMGVLVFQAFQSGLFLHKIACLVYGITLTLLYSVSTLYHAIPPRSARVKRWLQMFDHTAIYLFIAGTYTPITLVAMRGTMRITLVSVIWGLALLGVILKTTSLRKHKRLALALYLVMGWSSMLVIKPLVAAISISVLGMLLAGGVAYTVGVLFYIRTTKWSHAVWHGFVMAGSAFHFAAVALLLHGSLVEILTQKLVPQVQRLACEIRGIVARTSAGFKMKIAMDNHRLQVGWNMT